MKKMQRTEEKIRIAQWHLEVLSEGACSDEADSICQDENLDWYVNRKRMQDEVRDTYREQWDIKKWTEKEAQGYLTWYADGCREDPDATEEECTEEYAWNCIAWDYKNRWCWWWKRWRLAVKEDKKEKLEEAKKRWKKKSIVKRKETHKITGEQ